MNEDLPGEFKNLGLHKTLRNNLKKSIHCELVAKEIERSEGMAEKVCIHCFFTLHSPTSTIWLIFSPNSSLGD